MTWDEFRKKYNFREAEKCCSNCRHGEDGWEGVCNCSHPLIVADETSWPSGMVNDVCDLWEAKEGGAK